MAIAVRVRVPPSAPVRKQGSRRFPRPFFVGSLSLVAVRTDVFSFFSCRRMTDVAQRQGLSLSIRWMVDWARRPGSDRMAARACLLDDTGGLQACTTVRDFPNRVSPSWGSGLECSFLSFVSRAYTLGVSPACLSREFSGQDGLLHFSEANGQAPEG